jgi:cholesterol oxidase
VADGAIVPEALGLNPSKTIAALAERIAAIILEQRR